MSKGFMSCTEQPGRGVGAGLVDTLAAHALSEGNTTIASDCELFHKAIGFNEVIRSIHFIKPLI